MERPKQHTVTELRNLIYEEVDEIREGRLNPQKVKMLTSSTNAIIRSYGIQMTAMKEAGESITMAKLEGLIDN